MNWQNLLDFVGTVVVVLLWVAVLVMALTLLALAIGSVESGETKQIELCALSNGDGVTGSFFLGSGIINSSPRYVYMYRADDGSIGMDDFNADICYIVESDTAQPHAVCYYGHTRFLHIQSGIRRVVFHIPAGSIWQGYSVDVRR